MATKKNTVVLDNEKVLTVPLASIQIRHDWNARSGNWKDGSASEEGNDFKSLAASIEAEGQDEPVIVRPNPEISARGKLPHDLVAGYRRAEAIRFNADKNGDKNPTIRVVVRDLSESQARGLNIRENTARDDLKGPDLAWSIMELLKFGGDDSSIARQIGKSQPYVSKLHRIMQHAVSAVTKAWRASAVAVTVDDMHKIAMDVPHDKQEAAFKKLLEAKKAKKGDKTANKGKNRWIDTACGQAEKVGTLLGNLEREGLINTDDLDFSADTLVILGIKVKDTATPKQKQKIADSADKAYNIAMSAASDGAGGEEYDGDEDEDEDEDDEE